MIQPINWQVAIPILYLAILVFSMVFIAVKHEDLNPIWVLILSCLWPIYYITVLSILILEDHDDRQKYNKIKKTDHFIKSAHGKALINKANLSTGDINRIRKGRVIKAKKVNAKG